MPTDTRQADNENHRERLDRSQINCGGVFTIYLDPEGSDVILGEGAVDIRQLLANIPEEAIEEYERALEDAEDGDHDDAAEGAKSGG